MSLDLMQLKILSEAGKPHERTRAKRIIPLVSKHHLLLVTLLICNAGANEALPIFLDRLTNPVISVIVSVTAVLLFGE